MEGPERGGGPERAEQAEDAKILSSAPECAGQAEIDGGGRERDRSATVLDESSKALGGTEIGLMDDAGLAVDAGALDDVVVELVGFLFGDEGGHIG